MASSGPLRFRHSPAPACSARAALSLHQAIKNHRIALPDDEVLLDELISVRLRKNTLGIYPLDHDSGQHDDQAIALALGAHYLLDADGSAESWIRWAREKAIAAGAIIIDGQVTAMPESLPRAALPPAPRQGGARTRRGNLSSWASCSTRRPRASVPVTSCTGPHPTRSCCGS